jgi:ribose 5-phosphate isomerase
LQAKLVEVTDSQGKEIVTNMEKLGKIKEQNVLNQGIIATKTINYFKDHDLKSARNQWDMVQALESFSVVMGKALFHFGRGFGHPCP